MENSFDIPVARLVAEAQKLPESDRIAFLQLELQRFDDKHNRSIAETYVINQLNQLSRNIIVFIHGINTRAAWQEKFRTLLSQDQNIKVIPIKYGWFNPLWFWFPFFTRLGPIDRVLGQLRNIQKNHRNDNISIVSHSFGTYIVGSILKKNPDIVTHRLILSGCVLPESFAWDFLPTKPVLIINDVGGRDRWPIFAKSFSWGYGSSGSYGFGHHMVTDRFHDLGHSDFFENSFITSFWVPFLKDGLIENSSFERQAPCVLYELLPFLIKLVYIAGIILLIYNIYPSN